jgi:hypothetical protein
MHVGVHVLSSDSQQSSPAAHVVVPHVAPPESDAVPVSRPAPLSWPSFPIGTLPELHASIVMTNATPATWARGKPRNGKSLVGMIGSS